MNNILIWRDVLDEVLASDLENQVMFGIDGCVESSRTSKVYDFLFHLQNVDVEKIIDNDFWVVPVLPYEEDREKREGLVNVASRKNSFVDTVAVKSRGAIYHEKGGQKELKPVPHLEIYRVALGQKPIVVPGYDITNDEEMGKIVGNWEEIKGTLEGFREEVRSKYS